MHSHSPSKFGAIVYASLVTLAALTTSAQKTSTPSQERPTTNTPSSQKPIPPPEPGSAEADVVRVDTDLVNTLFTAIDKDHRFITTLRAEDIRVFENGSGKEISLFEHETDRPVTLAILIDTSKSQEETLPIEKRAAEIFTGSVVRADKDKVAVVSFTGKPRIEQELTSSVASVNRAIARLRVELPPDGCEQQTRAQEDPRCWTSIWDSVWASTNEILAQTHQGSRRAIILLTDGDDTSSTIKRQDAIE